MSSGTLIFLEITLVLGLVAAWAIWELRSLGRAKREREARENEEKR